MFMGNLLSSILQWYRPGAEMAIYNLWVCCHWGYNFIMCNFKNISDDNVKSGQFGVDSINSSLDVQTPPVNFIIQNKSVS